MKSPWMLATPLVVTGLAAAQEPIPFDSPRWEFDPKGAEVVQHLGRTSLHLRQGLAALVDDYRNFALEFDVSFSGERGFVGAVFRLEDAKN